MTGTIFIYSFAMQHWIWWSVCSTRCVWPCMWYCPKSITKKVWSLFSLAEHSWGCNILKETFYKNKTSEKHKSSTFFGAGLVRQMWATQTCRWHHRTNSNQNNSALHHFLFAVSRGERFYLLSELPQPFVLMFFFKANIVIAHKFQPVHIVNMAVI